MHTLRGGNEHNGQLKEYLSGLAPAAEVQGHRFHLYLCSAWRRCMWCRSGKKKKKSRLAAAPVAAGELWFWGRMQRRASSYLRNTWHALNTEDVLLSRSAAGGVREQVVQHVRAGGGVASGLFGGNFNKRCLAQFKPSLRWASIISIKLRIEAHL